MTPVSADALEPAPRGMGEFSRITGVFFEPKKTFQDIAARPRWIVPMLLIILFGLAFTITMSQHIGVDRMARQAMENNPRTAQMTPEQREQGVAIAAKFTQAALYIGPIIGAPLTFLVVGLVLWAIASGILSAGIKFGQVFAIACYAWLPKCIASVLGIVVMFLKNPDDFNTRNPIAFNPAAFMDPQTSSKFLYSIATSLDLFSIWVILLLAIGLKAAGGKRLSFGGALFAVLLPWGVIVLISAALAGAGLFG